jgi:LmbE family N-acetylglucosaminyl deacetylase
MMDTPPNNRPDVFWQADLEQASQHLVEIIDEIQPHVLITYDEIGGYGHPDHIQAHRVAMEAAKRSTWKIPKIYWNTMPKSVIADGIEKMKALGSDFFGAESADDLPFAKMMRLSQHLLMATNMYKQRWMRWPRIRLRSHLMAHSSHSQITSVYRYGEMSTTHSSTVSLMNLLIKMDAKQIFSPESISK